MKKIGILFFALFTAALGFSQKVYEKDTIPTSGGDLIITFLGHGSLLFTYQDRNIYVDPVGQVADFTGWPKASAILVTHDHGDHLDPQAIEKLSQPGTEVFMTELCKAKFPAGKVYANGGFLIAAGVPVEVVPAYNILNVRGNGKPYHPKGDGNGYILVFGQTRVYVAGDTELIPEMKDFKKIDIAFLPVALPYTMSVDMALKAARLLNPSILYPYHLNATNPEDIKAGLMDTRMDVRIRSLK